MPELHDALMSLKYALSSELHTMMPGKIVKYYPTSQTADVQPMVQRVYWADDAVGDVPAGSPVYGRFPLLLNVPVVFPGGSGCVIAFPLGSGDTVQLVFSESSMANFLESGTEGPQQDIGRHKLGSCVAQPVFIPTSQAPITDTDIVANDKIVLGQAGGVVQIQFDPVAGTVTVGKGATDFAALSSKVDAAVAAIVSFINSHTHAVSTTGSATAQTGTAAAVASPLASQPSSKAVVLKAK